MRRSTGRGRLTVNADGLTLDPWWVRRRLRRLLWRYDGGTAKDVGFDIGFWCSYPNPEKTLKAWYARVTALARYLRQPIDWVLTLDHDEAMYWEESLIELLRTESGGSEEPTPTPVAMDPWGFGDRG